MRQHHFVHGAAISLCIVQKTPGKEQRTTLPPVVFCDGVQCQEHQEISRVVRTCVKGLAAAVVALTC